MQYRAGSQRRGTTLIEGAIVYPVALALMAGVIVIGLGVFDYQQVNSLACEGARWASVHGGQYHIDTGNPLATKDSVYANGIKPVVAGLDTSQLTYNVTWDNNNEMPTNNGVVNYVTVTVNYNWSPVAYALGAISMSSTCKMAVSY
jgi:Flp pilus assembly protein TadG